MTEVKSFFRAQFRTSPAHVVCAPGRLELLGNHTDYNEGLVMAVAVDRFLSIASAPRKDGKIALASSAFAERDLFYADRITKNPASRWADYVKGVLLQLRKRGVPFTGFNAAIHSTLPIGAGMSSSAALEVATALTVRKLCPFTLTDTGLRAPPKRNAKGELPPLEKSEKLPLAKLCQIAERQFVGANVGLLDQISCLFGKAGHVIEIDCQSLSVTHEPMPPDVAIVVCDSSVKHDLAAAGGYNELRRHCESAARALGAPSLRSANPRRLEAGKSKLTPREYQCAYHIVGENQRVLAAERALRAGEPEQLAQYLRQSHSSSRDYFRNSCRELDLLVELATSQPACLGARLTGGGFGGATINLVRAAEAKGFIHEMRTRYEQKTGIKTEPMLCKVVDGAN